MSEPTINKRPGPTEEIDLVGIFLKIWKGRKTILICIGVFFVIGLFLTLISPREYQSQVTLLVEPGGSNPAATSAILKQLSALTGVPTGGSQDALTPALYPLVVGSVYFRLEVINQQVTDSRTDLKMTLSQYFDKHPATTLSDIITKYTIGLPGTIIAAVRGKPKTDNSITPSKPVRQITILPPPTSVPDLRSSLVGPSSTDTASVELSADEKSKIGMLASHITAEIKKGTQNLLLISVTMDDPMVTKDLARSVVITLTKYVTDYRTRKVKNDREFIEGLHSEAEKKYKRAQQTLAAYRDRNQNVVQSAARTEGESLKAEYDLSVNVYTSLSQLLEQAKINVQENTPVFTMIDPPSDAIKTSSSIIIVLISIFLGILIGICFIFGRPAFARLKKTLKEA